MKLNIKFWEAKLVVIVLLLGFSTGCSDVLEEDPSLARLSPSFSSADEVNAAVTGIYSSMNSTWGSSLQSSNGSIVYAYAGDDITTHKASNKAPFREFDQLNTTSTNTFIIQVYEGCYNIIHNANILLDNIESSPVSEVLKNEAIGQAQFLRSLAYYYLVRIFGDIPVVLTGVVENANELNKTQVKQVYDDVIIPGFKKAEELLPIANGVGKANKGVAKAYLAEAYLTMGGWPLKEADKYALAAAKAKEIIDNKGVYGYDLLPDFNDLWKESNKYNAESIFEGSHNIDQKSTICGKIGAPGDIGGWDEMFAEINFFNNFPAGHRKDATFLTEVDVDFTAGGVTMRSWEDFGVARPFYRKWLDGNGWIDGIKKVQSSSTTRNIYFMRYAEVLLIYAEAKARSGSVDASAYSAINKVRFRAGLEDLENLSNADFIKAAMDERSWELACEFKRWFDMTRAEIVVEVFASRNPDENPVIGNPSDTENWYAKFPQAEIELNPNLE